MVQDYEHFNYTPENITVNIYKFKFNFKYKMK